MGHWEKDGEWFWSEREILEDLDEYIWEEVDTNFEDWIDENYRASTIYNMKDDPQLQEDMISGCWDYYYR